MLLSLLYLCVCENMLVKCFASVRFEGQEFKMLTIGTVIIYQNITNECTSRSTVHPGRFTRN